jgi:soluble lytic murein transglycosylase-like protein
MGSLCSVMPFQRHFRVAAALVAVLSAAGLGLADWSGSTTNSYTVVAGDSLWSIATSRGLTVAQLASANHLNPNDILPIGVRLVLPSLTAQPTTVAAAAPTVDPWKFCSGFQPSRAPWGVLPSSLAGTPRYYRLRPLFQKWAWNYNVSLPLLEAVAWQESGWQQGVVSPTGAVGIGQIEPYTATFIEQSLVGQSLDINSASDNIRMSAAFLGYLADIEGNNTCATIAAYYEGPLNLQSLGVIPSAQQYVADVEYLESSFE